MNNNIFNKCTGKNVSVCFIDCCTTQLVDCIKIGSNTVKMPASDNGENHAELCIKAAMKVASQANYMLIDVGEQLIEENVLAALEYCLKNTINIIVMPFSFHTISEKFKEYIIRLDKRRVIMCSSVDPYFYNSYPQTMREVISINETTNEVEGEFYFENGVFYVNRKAFKDIFEAGSSIATGYMAGHFAKLLEFNPFSTKDTIIEYYDKIWEHKIKGKSNSHSISYFLNKGQHNIDAFLDMIHDSYKYYYDEDKKEFIDIKDNSKVDANNVDTLDIICGDDFQIHIPHLDGYPGLKIKHYDNIKNNCDLEIDSNSLKNINIPSICIGSYGMNMDKLYLQLNLNKQFKKRNFSIGNVTFNPIGHLFGYKYIQYPKKIAYPDYFYFINNAIVNEAERKDLIITSMPGSIDRFVRFSHILSEVPHIIMTTSLPDMIILSVSLFVEIKEIILIKHYIEKNIGAKLIIFVSKHNRDDPEYSANNYNTIVSNESVNAYAKRIALVAKIKVFTEDDLENEKMFKYIFKLFTK